MRGEGRLRGETALTDLLFLLAADVFFPSSSSRPGSGVPGWGIALLVLVCVLVALALVYLLALVSAQSSPYRVAPASRNSVPAPPRPLTCCLPQAVCQCRRKNCGQLDIFPTRDAYHPMSEYPTYHTHGRYVAPGGSKRSPYEEVSRGPSVEWGEASAGKGARRGNLGKVRSDRQEAVEGQARRKWVEVRRAVGERPGEPVGERGPQAGVSPPWAFLGERSLVSPTGGTAGAGMPRGDMGGRPSHRT